MFDPLQNRRDFIKFAAVSAAAVPLFAACSDDTFAQKSGDDLGTVLKRNAVQDKNCEWCGARDVPNFVSARAVLASTDEKGEWLNISGTVFGRDGKPFAGALIYLYHTDIYGIYGRDGEHKHGRYRGWMLTGNDGRYEFETIRPASYPNSTIAAHVHMTVTTKDHKEDWIDSIVFDGDRFITDRERASRKGGFNPILTLERDAAGISRGVRNIQLT